MTKRIFFSVAASFASSFDSSVNQPFPMPLIPRYVYQMPKKTRHGETSRFVYVIPKFTLGDNEKLQLSLKELKGNRELKLKRRL